MNTPSPTPNPREEAEDLFIRTFMEHIHEEYPETREEYQKTKPPVEKKPQSLFKKIVEKVKEKVNFVE